MSNAVATRRHLALVIDEDGVDSVWATLREVDAEQEALDAAEAREEAAQQHSDALLVNHLRDEFAATGRCSLVLGKRWVDCYDPVYAVVCEVVPECEIVCEYDLYRQEAEFERAERAAADKAAGLTGRLFGARAA